MTIDHETFVLLSADLDGELSPGEALAMARRLAAEPPLRGMAARLAVLSREVRGTLAVQPPSDLLRARVIGQIGFTDPAPSRSRWPAWRPLAAGLAIGLASGGFLGGGADWLLSPRDLRLTEDAVLAGHLRGLVASQPIDIASSSKHVVKPWFNGRTTVAPDPVDMADNGFPLAGGRIDIVRGKPMPTLVYRHERHVISVTVVPRGTDNLDAQDRRDGYIVRHWSIGDLTYWMVSDLDPAATDAFEHLFKEAGTR